MDNSEVAETLSEDCRSLSTADVKLKLRSWRSHAWKAQSLESRKCAHLDVLKVFVRWPSQTSAAGSLYCCCLLMLRPVFCCGHDTLYTPDMPLG